MNTNQLIQAAKQLLPDSAHAFKVHRLISNNTPFDAVVFVVNGRWQHLSVAYLQSGMACKSDMANFD